MDFRRCWGWGWGEGRVAHAIPARVAVEVGTRSGFVGDLGHDTSSQSSRGAKPGARYVAACRAPVGDSEGVIGKECLDHRVELHYQPVSFFGEGDDGVDVVELHVNIVRVVDELAEVLQVFESGLEVG